MTRTQTALVLHALALTALMLMAVPWLTRNYGGPAGWFASIVLYWALFCIPVIVIHLGRAGLSDLMRIRIGPGQGWVLWLLGVQVALVAIGTTLTMEVDLVMGVIGLAILTALINGTLEEAAWRGGFYRVFGDRRALGFGLGLFLFTLWHVPLALAEGIDYGTGGAAALIGGSAFLGLVWSTVMWRTGSVFWVSLAHVATNVFAFAALFSSNAFV
jgi:membrane protease YdiL (CAAX protease family)